MGEKLKPYQIDIIIKYNYKMKIEQRKGKIKKLLERWSKK